MVLLALGLMLAAPPAGDGIDPTFRRRVANMLDGDEYKRDELIQGNKIYYSVFLDLLSADKTDPMIKGRIMNVLAECPGDKKQFLQPALRYLSDTEWVVRHQAVLLIPHVGDREHSAAVTALLFDPDHTIVFAAAKSLALIGGPPEVVAFDIWLAREGKVRHAVLRNHVAEQRDQLKARLDKAAPPKK